MPYLSTKLVLGKPRVNACTLRDPRTRNRVIRDFQQTFPPIMPLVSTMGPLVVACPLMSYPCSFKKSNFEIKFKELPLCPRESWDVMKFAFLK